MSNEYFKLTPVSEKPEKEGWYVVLNQDATFQLYFKGTTWMMAPNLPEHHHPDFDSWLRPVSFPVQSSITFDRAITMLQTKIEICKTHTDLKKFTAGLVFAQQLFLGESQHLTIQPSSPTAAAQEERNTAPWIQIWDMVHKCSNPMHFVESAELKAFIDKYYPTVTTQGEGSVEDDAVKLYPYPGGLNNHPILKQKEYEKIDGLRRAYIAGRSFNPASLPAGGPTINPNIDSVTIPDYLQAALENWVIAHKEFETGYRNKDGQTTRIGIAELSTNCNQADTSLRKAFNQIKAHEKSVDESLKSFGYNPEQVEKRGISFINLLKENAELKSHLAGGQSARVWVKAYYKEGKTVGLPPKGKEQILIRYDDNRELGDWVLIEELLENGWLNVEWLDESLQPATTGEAIAFDRLAYRYADDDGNFPLSRYQPLFDKLYEITAKAFLQDEMFEIIDVVRKMDGIALTPSPNATERQEGEKKGGPGIDEPFLCDVCGTNTVSKDGDMCNVCNHP